MQKLSGGAIALALMLAATPALAQPTIDLTSGKSTVLMLQGIKQVSIADPSVADVTVTPQRDLLVSAKKPGTTSLILWTRDERLDFQVNVAMDVSLLRTLLDRTLGANAIRIDSVSNRVILSGKVYKASQLDMASKLSQAFAKNVINLVAVETAPQVQVDVHVVEMRRGHGHDAGVTWGSMHPMPTGEALFQPELMTFAESAAGSAVTFGQFDRLAAQLKVLATEGYAKILARPKLVTVSGGKASFLVGGQIPVPEAQQLGTVTVAWRDYGVKLNVEPRVREDGRISMKVKPEVSALDFNNAIRVNGFTIPSISARQAETEVMLRPGEGLAIGGLIQNTETRMVEKLPLLGDIPVLGALFRSTQFQQDETELAIFVTPQLVTPMASFSSPVGSP